MNSTFRHKLAMFKVIPSALISVMVILVIAAQAYQPHHVDSAGNASVGSGQAVAVEIQGNLVEGTNWARLGTSSDQTFA